MSNKCDCGNRFHKLGCSGFVNGYSKGRALTYLILTLPPPSHHHSCTVYRTSRFPVEQRKRPLFNWVEPTARLSIELIHIGDSDNLSLLLLIRFRARSGGAG
jgi:hypothetical protein